MPCVSSAALIAGAASRITAEDEMALVARRRKGAIGIRSMVETTFAR